MQNLWYNQSYMNKTRAIIKYCIICLIVSLAVVLCFAEFTIPFTNTKYVGCYQAIKDKMEKDRVELENKRYKEMEENYE